MLIDIITPIRRKINRFIKNNTNFFVIKPSLFHFSHKSGLQKNSPYDVALPLHTGRKNKGDKL